MADNTQERLQKAGSELDQANSHVSSVREMGEGQESFLDLFELLKGTLTELFHHSSTAYGHIAQAYKFDQAATQALTEAGFEIEAHQANDGTRQKCRYALEPAVESIQSAEAFASERVQVYNDALLQTTKAMGVLQLRAADCQDYILEAKESINRYPSS